jgi:acyl-CoA synthetase (AMP-forming)/AMP-acid ligase II
MICGGAPVPEPMIATYQRRGLTFMQGYGMTESAPGALFLRADDSVTKIGSAGTPAFFTDVKVVRPDGAPVDPGRAGRGADPGPQRDGRLLGPAGRDGRRCWTPKDGCAPATSPCSTRTATPTSATASRI